MRQSTKDAIIALVCVDDTATKAEKDAVQRALTLGVATMETVTQVEAARRLGVTSRTVRNLVHRNKLRCAGGGTTGRITVQSIMDFAR